MTGSSSIAKSVALSLAVIVHAGLVAALVARDTPMIDGSAGASEVRLGNAFADMAAGTLTAEQGHATAPDTATEATPQEQPDRIMADGAKTVEPAAPDRPVQSAPLPPREELAALRPEVAAPLQRPELTADITADEVMSSAPVASLRAAKAVPLRPTVPKPHRPDPASERLDASEPQSAAVSRSARPKPRSAEFVETRKPRPVEKSAPKPAAEQPQRTRQQAQGNAAQNARAGEASGTLAAVARQEGTGGQEAAGNAAASNYPGLVMRTLSRAGKPRVTARGAAVVAFTISENGGIAVVSLARSSGSSALDQAAVRLVRSAGPFPKPPHGARRSFSIRIEGR